MLSNSHKLSDSIWHHILAHSELATLCLAALAFHIRTCIVEGSYKDVCEISDLYLEYFLHIERHKFVIIFWHIASLLRFVSLRSFFIFEPALWKVGIKVCAKFQISTLSSFCTFFDTSIYDRHTHRQTHRQPSYAFSIV